MAKLEVGEKYLSIKIVGHESIAAFKNKEKTNPKSPDYQGNGVSVWINEKKVEETMKDEGNGL